MMRFEFDNILSIQSAIDMLLDLALYGNHYDFNGSSISSLAVYLEQRGKTIPSCAQEMRDYSKPPKYFYNLVGPTIYVSGAAKTVMVDGVTGESETVLEGSGQFNWTNYWGKFDQANLDFSSAVKTSNHELLLGAFSKAQACIENFLNTHLGSSQGSVESKLKRTYLNQYPNADWDIERQKQPWQSFIAIKSIRNEYETHNKYGASGFSYEEIQRHFNLFPRGIGDVLVELHKIAAKKECPSDIIKLKYHPVIRLVECQL